MLEFEYSEEAGAELLGGIAFYEEAQRGLGARFSTEVRKAIDLARQFPDAGSPHRVRTKRVIVNDFPYSVVYRVRHDLMRIIALEHHSRKPGYWKGRN